MTRMLGKALQSPGDRPDGLKASYRCHHASAGPAWRRGRGGPSGRHLALLLIAFVLALAACSRIPAEQRLRETVAAMETAVEAGRSSAFMRHVSDDFSGNHGDYDRSRLHATLRGVMLRYRDIGVVLGPLAVTLHGEDRATVAVDVLVTGGSGGLLPESGRRLRIESGWRLEDGDWRCISASWQ